MVSLVRIYRMSTLNRSSRIDSGQRERQAWPPPLNYATSRSSVNIASMPDVVDGDGPVYGVKFVDDPIAAYS